MWSYDLNLYTIAYLDSRADAGPVRLARAIVAATAPLFALAARREEGWRIRLSRAATFQSLSLLAICGYFAVMAILATALRGTSVDWSRGLLVGLLGSHDRRGNGPAAEREGARLGQGQDRQAFLRASLRLSHRMAALHRHGRNHRRRCARRSASV